MIRLFWFLALLLSLPAIAPLADETSWLNLSAATRQASLAGFVALHVDEHGDLAFERAAKLEYSQQTAFRSCGYSADSHWFRFRLRRDADAPADWLLALGEPYLDEVRVWIEAADGSVAEYQLGDHVAVADRPMQARPFVVPIELPNSEPVEIYVGVRSISAINFNAEIWRPETFHAAETFINFYHGLYFGVSATIVLTYLLLGIWLRDRGMLTYAAYVASTILLFLCSNGYTALLLTSGWTGLNDALMGIGVVGGASIALVMWSSLLDLKRHFPRFNRLCLVAAAVCAALLPCVVSPYYRVVVPVILGAVGVFTILIMALLIALWRRSKQPELLLYLCAFVVAELGGMLHMGQLSGVLPNNFATSNAYQTALLVQILVMSFGLSLHVRQIQRDKALADRNRAVAEQLAAEQRLFVAMLSHEFRNPLASIDRAAQMIQFKLPGLAEPEAGRLETIRAGVATLSSLVDNFLVSEALDHRALALSRRSHPVSALLESVVAGLGESAEARVALSVSPPNAEYLLDTNLIGMAVANLLGNALRYSTDLSQVTLSAIVDHEGLAIHVADHGPGMRKDELAMLGMPYFRASSSIGKKGSGLGYHFSRRIVEAHGGSLYAYSGPEGGMDVVIWLPRELDDGETTALKV